MREGRTGKECEPGAIPACDAPDKPWEHRDDGGKIGQRL
jgi:hypothetical protein